jgi:acyl-CoA synthetase (AMP-forming)/AMP-acid ligase II
MAGVTLAPAAHLPPAEMDGKPHRSVAPPSDPATDPDSQVGELYCHHPWGFEAYIDDHGQPIAAATTWFKTGDLARCLPDGTVQILGRADNSINRDGYLVLLADIEQAIEHIEAIAQVVVLATETEEKRGQHLVAWCSLHADMPLDSAQIRARCFDILPRYAIPDEVIVIDVFPTLPSGKIDRQALRATVGMSA